MLLLSLINSTSCLIKDMDSELALLRGTLRDGLYQLVPAFDSPMPKSSQTVTPFKASEVAAKHCFKTFDVSSFPNKNCIRQNLIFPDLPLDVNVAQADCVGQQLYAKLGHPTYHVLKHVLNKIQVSCPKFVFSFCDSYKIGKSHQLSFSSCPITAKKPLELVYSDVWGLAPVTSVESYRYYIVFIDAYTRYSWFYPLN